MDSEGFDLAIANMPGPTGLTAAEHESPRSCDVLGPDTGPASLDKPALLTSMPGGPEPDAQVGAELGGFKNWA